MEGLIILKIFYYLLDVSIEDRPLGKAATLRLEDGDDLLSEFGLILAIDKGEILEVLLGLAIGALLGLVGIRNINLLGVLVEGEAHVVKEKGIESLSLNKGQSDNARLVGVNGVGDIEDLDFLHVIHDRHLYSPILVLYLKNPNEKTLSIIIGVKPLDNIYIQLYCLSNLPQRFSHFFLHKFSNLFYCFYLMYLTRKLCQVLFSSLFIYQHIHN
jgi:hypothetical protein